MFLSRIDTPIGILTIKANDTHVYAITCDGDESSGLYPNALTDLASHQLQEYFESARHTFDFPMAQQGTAFQQKVWNELLQISPGQPITYAALAKRFGNPLAIRAIASANGKNQLMIVVPCHRVIGSSGKLVGYAGGLWRKKWLLEHETKMTRQGQTLLL